MHLIAIWSDKVLPKDARNNRSHANSLAYRLSDKSVEKRGNPAAFLWPPMWHASNRSPTQTPAPAITTLELKSVNYTSRSIIMNFGVLYFQVSGIVVFSH